MFHGTQYAAHDGTKDRRGNGAAVVFTRLRIVDNQQPARSAVDSAGATPAG